MGGGFRRWNASYLHIILGKEVLLVMAEGGYWFAPETDETSFLGQLEINDPVSAEVRVVNNNFRNDENGYSVYDVEDTNYRRFKINGYFPTKLKIDGYYIVDGVVKDGKYGRVLQVMDYRSSLPQEKDAVITVLRTLPQLDTRAPEVYDILGANALEIILNDPEQVARKVRRVGSVIAKQWQQALLRFKQDDAIIKTLQEYQIPAADAKRLLEKYPDIIERLKVSPYFLAEEIRGFGFPKCDKIALSNGYAPDGQERLEQAMLYVLRQDGIMHGNCFMRSPQFAEQVSKVVDITLDYNTAQAILKDGSDNPLFLKVERKSLMRAISEYRADNSKSFRFVVTKVSGSALKTALGTLRGSNRIVVEDDRVYLGSMYQAEVSVARCLKNMAASEYGVFSDVEKVLDEVCAQDGIVLEEMQRTAVMKACASRGGVLVLNGQAGCGKTFTLNVIIKVLKELYKRAGLYFTAEIMAPTGQAAQVAHRATGLPASTVHRALHIVVDQEQTGNTETVIGSECVVIDEFSMMGLKLASTLFSAIQPGSKTIIMGDFEQLQSIDPGNVLKDIIDSGTIPVVTLNVVKRQGAGSGILINANKILTGEPIRSQKVNEEGIKNNAYIFRNNDPVAARKAIVSMAIAMRRRGYKLQDIQILCPQKQTDVGVNALNYAMQTAFNPPRDNVSEVFSRLIEVHDDDGRRKKVQLMLREGDKVVNTANNYDMKFYNFRKGEGFVEDFTRVGVVNGEMGRIAKIMKVTDGKTTHQRVYVQVSNGQYIMYEDNWDDLSMAYAMTIHRSQGSQWPIVIAPVMYCNKSMLSRKILYTLYTRAQEANMIYGTPESIQYAIDNTYSARRNTWLKERLRAA